MAPNNSLPIHGNEKTMNLNHLILTNIQSSPYFKVNLFELKTYHEVIDEIYYKVNHLEPWEKGSRKTAGQTGMCGGVRGVGAGGIVSSAYCLLYKLFTLRLTRKQVIGLLTHQDSPYIRGLGFMYIRYTQPPADLWDWYEEYLDDDEEIDVKAGGGHTMTMGEMVRQFLSKLEWYSTLFPRIPVPVQKSIETNLKAHPPMAAPRVEQREEYPVESQEGEDQVYFGEAERIAKLRNRSSSRERQNERKKSPPQRQSASRESERHRGSADRSRRSRSRDKRTSRSQEGHRERNRHRSRSRDRERRQSRSRDRKERKKDRSRERRRSRSRDRHRDRDHRRSRDRDVRESSFERDLRREQERQRKHDSKSSHRDRHSER